MTIFDALLGRRADRQQSAAEAYEALVSVLASGKSVAPENAEAVLEAVGRTPEDLQQAVEDLQHREKLREIVATEVAAKERLTVLSQRLEAARAVFQSAAREFEAEEVAIAREQAAEQSKISKAEAARRELMRSAAERSEAVARLTSRIQERVRGRLTAQRMSQLHARFINVPEQVDEEISELARERDEKVRQLAGI